MRVRVWLLILLIVGCDREPVHSIAPAATQSATEAPPASQPTSLASSSVIWIDQKQYEFPPALLVMQRTESQLDLQLLTDDPPEVQQDGYAGNSLYLPMLIELPAEPEEPITQARWQFQAPKVELADTIGGITLHGQRKLLQPFDVTVTIMGQESVVTVTMGGTWLLFDQRDLLAPPEKVAVMAELVTPVRSSRPAATAPP